MLIKRASDIRSSEITDKKLYVTVVNCSRARLPLLLAVSVAHGAA